MPKHKSNFLCWLDKRRLVKDEMIAKAVDRLPRWVTPNQVTWLRTFLLVIWLPFLIINPSWQQIIIF